MGRADIYPVYDQTPADYSIFDRKITLRFASDGYRINGRQGPDVYNSFIGRPQRAEIVVETRRSQLTIRVWPVWVPAELRANRMLRNGSSLRSYNDFAGRNGSGHCGESMISLDQSAPVGDMPLTTFSGTVKFY